MRAYEVRIFVPTVYTFEAEDDADAVEKVGEVYKELYRKHFRDWIAPLPEPEDFK